MRLGFFDFIKSQYTKVPPVPKADLSGKTVIVTGANIGMNPAKLILACRNREKGDAAVNVIKQETGFQGVELWLLDLASFASIREEGGRLDILVENAANAPPMGSVDFTNDGWETSKDNTTPRLVVLASEVHYWAVLERRVLDAPNPLREYGHKNNLKDNTESDAASFECLVRSALNDRLHRKPVIVSAVNPGYCYSGLRRKYGGITLLFDRLMEILLARSTEEGSRIPVWAAVGIEERKDELRGAYINLMHVDEPSDFVISEEGEEVRQKIWNNLIEELSQVEPKVAHIVKENLTPPVRN
ncbi:hypothetical protein CPB84DRAFT_1774142 [Gymnopilus junonius]|uniref:Short-chain dehydrogenase n=1 Tax=Gymnopilus junonius TaxID=109634 RepID=A0A9P5NTM4_GYMJU|nr:hypothetical protein CPB84DRAFT_1774142 [Gymnopilus junonius]